MEMEHVTDCDSSETGTGGGGGAAVARASQTVPDSESFFHAFFFVNSGIFYGPRTFRPYISSTSRP